MDRSISGAAWTAPDAGVLAVTVIALMMSWSGVVAAQVQEGQAASLRERPDTISEGQPSEQVGATEARSTAVGEGADGTDATDESRPVDPNPTTLGLGLGFNREVVTGAEASKGYGGILQLDVLMPLEPRPGLLRVATVGVSGWGTPGHWGGGLDIGVGFGYWTHQIVFYGGPLFTLSGHAADQKIADAGMGGFLDAGVDMGGFRLMFDVRARYRVQVRAENFGHYSYGGLLSVDL